VVHELLLRVMSLSLLLHVSDAFVEDHVFPKANVYVLRDLSCLMVE